MTKRDQVQTNFSSICDLVRKGETIQKALKSLGICSRIFYLYLTAEQKLELKQIKVANAIGNSATAKNSDLKQLDQMVRFSSDYFWD